MRNARITVSRNGSARWAGVDAGPLSVHHATQSVLVIKAASHKYWAGIGRPQRTAETRFYVFTITERTDNSDGSTSYHCDELTSFPLRKQDK